MSGSLRVDTSGLDWSKIELGDAQIERALTEGARLILARSDELVPKAPGETHDGQEMLVATGAVQFNRGGAKTVGIVYDSVYAHWIHEHLWFKHPHGGQAKFLETAMLEKGRDALNVVGRHLL